MRSLVWAALRVAWIGGVCLAWGLPVVAQEAASAPGQGSAPCQPTPEVAPTPAPEVAPTPAPEVAPTPAASGPASVPVEEPAKPALVGKSECLDRAIQPADLGARLPQEPVKTGLAAPPPEVIAAAPTPAVGLPQVELGGEYRVRTVQVNPYDLSGTEVRDVTWTEQRLRLDVDVNQQDVVKLHLKADLLDGVLFGDNGTFNEEPPSFSGVGLAVKRPNALGWGVGLRPGTNPVDPDNYVPVFRRVEPIEVVHAYADVLLPVGLLRVGRQPQAYGANLASHDGERHNRWGVSDLADVTDRVLFGTKLDQAFWVLMKGKDHTLDLSQDNGLFLGVFYDWLTQGSLLTPSDDVSQTGFALQFKKQSADWGGLEWRDAFAGVNAVHLTDDKFDSDVWGFPVKLQGSIEDVDLELQGILIRGESREISTGFAALSSNRDPNRPPELQRIEGMGFRGVLDWHLGPLTVTWETDYASGDDDPRASTPITMYSFARSFNIGLLLFEHIVAFESARSVAVGVETLKNKRFESFPLTEASTEGRFTNALAIFPQLKLDLLDNGKHKVHVRAGALLAWPADDGVVDAIQTILGEDGRSIEDDKVNYHGGNPGNYYGTEFDLQLEWGIRQLFLWTVEGAALLPGNSLEDANGDAVPAFLVENRFTFLF